MVFMCLSLAAGFLGARLYSTRSGNTGNTENARRIVNEESQLISSIAETVGPSVVSINVTSPSGQVNRFTGEVFSQQTAGTGFIISDSGYILTNRHVIPAGVSRVTVTMADDTQFEDVEVVGRTQEDDTLDVAFLKIADTKGKKLDPVNLGNSDEMQVGDMVVAIGNALGQFQNTVTSGIISGYGRNIEASGGEEATESLQNLFQTDAAINQGNSGGPLVNAEGQVIGINTAVATGGAENIGFAIPINDARGLIKGIIDKGQLLRPYIGVRYLQLDKEVAEELEISQTEGAYISEDSEQGPGILPDSPASSAGLRAKDIITQINGIKVTSERPLTSVISRYSVGEKVKITYLRDGKKQTVELTLKAAPNN